MQINQSTFIGCDADFAAADIVLFGAPFDSTTSFRPGARFAAQAMRPDSYGLETYSPRLDLDLTDFSIMDSGDLELVMGCSDVALNQISDHVDEILAAAKIPAMIGGEHLVTLGALRSVVKKYPGLHIIHFDAHTDLRENYLGNPLSHACVIRRAWELVGDGHIWQFGIRSGLKEEFTWAKSHTHLQKFDFSGLANACAGLKGQPVYFTLDLDVLDPAYFPGTGTPEPCGVTVLQLLDAIRELRDLDIVGFDVNELSPHYDASGVSTAVACKVLRELLLQVAAHRRTKPQY